MTSPALQWSSSQDQSWADRLQLRLVVHHHASAELVREVLCDVHQACVESGQAASDLFGPADAYAAETSEQRASAGPQPSGDAARPAPAAVLLLGSGLAGLMLCLALVATQGWMIPIRVSSLVLLTAGLVSAGAGVAGWQARLNGRLRRSGWLLTLAVLLLVGGVALAPAAAAAGGPGRDLPLVVLLLVACMAVVAGWLWPTGRSARSEETLSPDVWFDTLYGLLRGQWSVPREQARRMTEEARSHWARSGAAHPHEDFDSPRSYAAHLSAGESKTGTNHRRTWLFIGATLGFAGSALVLSQPATPLLVVAGVGVAVSGALAVAAWRSTSSR